MNCNTCGTPLEDADLVCPSCNRATSEVAQQKPTARIVTSKLSEYYQIEFQKIQASNEQYKGKWNWAAFLAGPIWAFTKGLKEVVVIYALAILFTFGISVLVYAVIFGLRGNYIYYTKLMKGRVLII